MLIRPATPDDDDAIWRVLQPVFRSGETYPLPRDITRAEALAYWHTPGNTVFVTEDIGGIVGTYNLRANQRGGGAHVCNCGYVVEQEQTRKGIARAMCIHSLDRAREHGFKAMQFNFVVSTNSRAVKLWHSMGFETVGRLPHAFHHPTRGHVDAFVMFRTL